MLFYFLLKLGRLGNWVGFGCSCLNGFRILLGLWVVILIVLFFLGLKWVFFLYGVESIRSYFLLVNMYIVCDIIIM